MTTALLTFLGGMRDKAVGNKPIYQQTIYRFPDGSEVSTDYFAAALRKKQDFNQIIIFGTTTSIWEKLAEDAGDMELALDLFAQTDEDQGAGLEEASLRKLEKILSKNWGVEVILIAGDGGITSENVQMEMMRYVGVLQRIHADEILLDFTHGFRSMPMLLNSALDFWQSLYPVRTPIRMVYGEFRQRSESTVHYLDDIQHTLRVAHAVRFFFEKMDGSELAKLVGDFWPSGEKALNALTIRIQENRLNQIEEPLRQLLNALVKMSHPEKAPPWFPPIHARLKAWIQSIQGNTLPQTLANLAGVFFTNKLHAQAILALDESLMEAILVARGQPSRTLTAEQRNEIFKDSMNDLEKELKNRLRKMHNFRNFVAHGAREDSKQQGRPPGSPSVQIPKFQKLLEPILLEPERYFRRPELPLK